MPTSRREIADYYRRIRPELRFDARTRDVAQALLARGDDAMTEPMRLMVFAAGRDLLPDWAAAMHGTGHGSVPALAAPAIRSGARGMGRVLRWALAAG